MPCAKALSLVLATLHLLQGAPAARAQEHAACVESATLPEFIACLLDRSAAPDNGAKPICGQPPRVAVPLAGRRVVAFGDQAGLNRKSNGIVIEGAAGATIAAPVSGQILFSGGWRDYGQLVIVDAGCSAQVLLAGLFTATVASGERVEKGQLIGKMAEFASPDLPLLYLEVRENGVARNPEP